MPEFPIHEPFTFSQYPLPYIWFYLNPLVSIALFTLPIFLYFQSRRWPWLLIPLVMILPWLQMIPHLGSMRWDFSMTPMRFVDFRQDGIESFSLPPVRWRDLAIVLTLGFVFWQNRTQASPKKGQQISDGNGGGSD